MTGAILHFLQVRCSGDMGKDGCKVPVLLIKVVKKAVILLMGKREAVRINLRNTYLFATPSVCPVSHLCPWDCLHGVAHVQGCSLKNPEAITCTHLGKYSAAVSQVLDIEDKGLWWVRIAWACMGDDIQ